MTGQAAQMAGQPDPRTKLEQQKLEAEIARGQAELQMAQQKGVAQMQMDRARSEAVLALQRETMMLEAQLKREQLAAEMELKREQLAAELQLKRELAMQEMQMKRGWPGDGPRRLGCHCRRGARLMGGLGDHITRLPRGLGEYLEPRQSGQPDTRPRANGGIVGRAVGAGAGRRFRDVALSLTAGGWAVKPVAQDGLRKRQTADQHRAERPRYRQRQLSAKLQLYGGELQLSFKFAVGCATQTESPRKQQP